MKYRRATCSHGVSLDTGCDDCGPPPPRPTTQNNTDRDEQQGEALKPCPNIECRSEKATLSNDFANYYVYCGNCFLRGPRESESTGARWNALPRASIAAIAGDALPDVLQNYINEVRERFVNKRDDMNKHTALAFMDELEQLLINYQINRHAPAAASSPVPAEPAQPGNDSCSHWREGDSDNCVWCGDDLGPTTEADIAPAQPEGEQEHWTSDACGLFRNGAWVTSTAVPEVAAFLARRLNAATTTPLSETPRSRVATMAEPKSEAEPICGHCGRDVICTTVGPPINDITWSHVHNGVVWCNWPAAPVPAAGADEGEPKYGSRFGQYSTNEEAAAVDHDDD